jgi:hypothetical protein
MEKQKGTADVTLVFWIDGIKGQWSVLNYIERRFAAHSRRQGTVIIGGATFEPAYEPDAENEPPGYRVRLRYTHTCKNRWNHDHDAQRFLEKMWDEDGEHWGHFLQAELNAWEPVE